MSRPEPPAGDVDVAAARVLLRADWTVSDLDGAAEELWGESKAGVVDRPLWDALPGTADLDMADALRTAMQSTAPVSVEGFHPHLGAWLHLDAVPAEGGLELGFADVTLARVGDARAASALRRLALLARVGDALASTDDPDEAVGRLARLVVPQLADWSFITVIEEDGRLRDLGLAHRDPRRYDDLAAYSARHLDEMTETAAVWRALHGTEPVVVPRLSPEILAAFIPDPTAAALTRRLDPYGVAAIPLVARGRTFGALTLVTTSARGSHTDDQITAGVEVARRAAPVLETARAARRARRLGESMQRSVLTVPPPGEHVQVATRYRPAFHDRQVGGDWYDTFSLSDGSCVITIGDVMGHDVAAIASMAQLRSLLRGTAWTLRQSPAQVLATADRASFGLGTDVFATAFTADLSPPDDDGHVRMTWSNAGHPPPVIVSAAGDVLLLTASQVDPPLGVVPAAPRHDREHVLAAGDLVLLYTDGLIERRDRDVTDGLEQLTTLLHGADTQDLHGLLDRILTALATEGVTDDIALLAARIPSHLVGNNMLDPQHRGDLVELRLPFDPVAPAVGRDLVRRHCSRLAAEQRADVELLVSELVGNAIRHGQPPVLLQLRTDDGSLWVAVSDAGPSMPAVRNNQPDTATNGRGLLITEALASAWGVEPTVSSPGKTVWFRLDTGEVTGGPGSG